MIRQSRGNTCVPHKHDVVSVEGIHICVYMYMCGHNWFHNWILYIVVHANLISIMARFPCISPQCRFDHEFNAILDHLYSSITIYGIIIVADEYEIVAHSLMLSHCDFNTAKCLYM